MMSFPVRARTCYVVTALVLLNVFGAGCSTLFAPTYHGPRRITDRTLIAKITEGVSTKEDVRALLGEPMIPIGDPRRIGYAKDDEIWFYRHSRAPWFSKDLLTMAFTLKTEGLTVVFDSGGVVKHTEEWTQTGLGKRHPRSDVD